MEQRHQKIARVKHPFPYRINLGRLKQDVLALGNIGRNADDNGIYRIAFSDADIEGRRWLMQQMEQAGLIPYMDEVANVFGGFEKDETNQQPYVLVGSHLDSVPCGGTLDGALGVLAGLECMRIIKEQGLKTKYPIEVVAFSDEEGRFGGMLGAQAFSGDLTPEDILSKYDVDGHKLTDVMEQQQLMPLAALEAKRDPDGLHAYLELHIEQGPVLERTNNQIGVVEGIAGLFKWSARLIGAANHAGATPMDMRNDAFQGLADFAHEIPRILDENGTPLSRATVGKIDLEPGFPHTIPERADFTLVVRDTNKAVLNELHDAFRKALSAIARRRALKFEYDLISWIDPIDCDPQLIDCIEQSAVAGKVSYMRMPSGAGHDAQFLHKVMKTGMVFVPSKDGKSHSPAEWTDWNDIEAGANVLLNALIEVAQPTNQNQ